MTLPPSTLVLGGAASGKSLYAENLVRDRGGNPVYIATAQALDEEMQNKIALHRKRRGDRWRVVEEPLSLVDALKENNFADATILVDCLTLWLSNLLANGCDVLGEIDRLVRVLSNLSASVVFVSNELGLGVVPENAAARHFRNLHGVMNQSVAAAVERVIFVTAGLPSILKGASGP
jgi:adenosylcobinamide kinase/adenosylcobinamide-phosphate guanylyltransferase